MQRQQSRPGYLMGWYHTKDADIPSTRRTMHLSRRAFIWSVKTTQSLFFERIMRARHVPDDTPRERFGKDIHIQCRNTT